MLCKSSAGSASQLLLRLGLFKDENTANMVTLPAASITARSDPVGLQQICFKGPPSSIDEKLGVTVGSLRAQVPFLGWQRRLRNSKAAPLAAMLATLPHFDHAIPLGLLKMIPEVGILLTGNSHCLSARLVFGRALLTLGLRVVTSQRPHQKVHPCPFPAPSSRAF